MTKNKTAYGLLFALITVFLGLLTALIPEIILFSGIVALACYAISSYMLPKNFAFLTPIVTAVIVYFLSSSIYLTVFTLLVFFPGGYLLALFIKREIDIKNTLLYSIVAQVIGFGTLITSYIYIRGGALNLNSVKFVFSNYIEIINNSIAQYQMFSKELYPNDVEKYNALFVQFKSFLIENVVPIIPALLTLLIGFCVFTAFIITIAILKGFHFEISNSLSIKNFKVSKSVVIFAVISLLGFFATDTSSINVAFENVFLVLNGALFIAGIAFIINFMNLLKIVYWKKVIGFLCIAFLCLLGGATIVSFFGGVSSFVEVEKFKKND